MTSIRSELSHSQSLPPDVNTNFIRQQKRFRFDILWFVTLLLTLADVVNLSSGEVLPRQNGGNFVEEVLCLL